MREAGLQRLASLNLQKNSRDYLVMHYLINDLSDVIKAFGGRHIFDIGCGNKPYESLFKSENKIYKGCDVVQSSLERVDIICEATSIPEPDSIYDTVICTQVLEHVDNPEKVLREANRLLVENGHLIISIPFAWELHEEPFDFFRYSKYGIIKMLERNGFEVLVLKANGGKWAAITQLNLNIIYSTFGKSNFLTKVWKGIFINLRLTSLINSIGKWVDKKWHDELLTLNYVVVARKR